MNLNHPCLSNNARFIIQYAKENACNFEECASFDRDPINSRLFKEAELAIEDQDEIYDHWGREHWRRSMHEQIREWANLPEVPTSPPDTPTPHTNHMNYSDKPVAQPTLVFGTDVADMNANQCITAIKANNASITALLETGIDSPYITEQVNGLKDANMVLVGRLDSFATPTA